MIERQSRWRRPAARIACSAVLAFTLISCGEDPTEQNALLAPSTLPAATIRDTLVYALHDSTFRTRLPMDGVRDLVGAGGGYYAASVIQFIPGLFPARDTVSVLSATLQLYMDYHIGPAGGTIAFNVYRMNRQWDPTTLDWDSLQAGIYDPSILRGSYIGSVTADSGVISVPLDTTMVREWLRTSTSTDVTKFGIALVPTSASNVIVGFQSFSGDSVSRVPLVSIVAGNASQTSLDTSNFSSGINTFAGDAPVPTDPATVSIQSGIADRGWLYFDLSFLRQGSVVNSAQLMVDREPQTQFVNRMVDTSLAAHLATGTVLTTFEGSSSTLLPVSGSATTIAGDVTHIAQSWIRANYGLVLRSTSITEFGSFDLIRLYGVRSGTVALHPRMRIVYSSINLGRRP